MGFCLESASFRDKSDDFRYLIVDFNYILIRRSRTDPTGERTWAFAPDTTFQRLGRWFDMAGVEDGPVFRGINNSAQTSASRLVNDATAPVVGSPDAST
ncbi:MAG: hypothetical protein KDC35_13190 [Acidobacteria bacterium]|nr:hypothetical protein [Acidobacteriota bacterium]